MTPQQVGAFAAACFEGKNLRVVGILMAVALFAGNWMVAKVALLVYAILVVKTATDPAYVRKSADEAAYVRGEVRGTKLPGSTGARLRGKHLAAAKRAREIADEVRRQVGGIGDAFVRSQLEPMVPGLDDMVKRIDQLSAAAQELEGEAGSGEQLAREVAELERQTRETADGAARQHYESALEQKRKVLENVGWIRETAARLDAELVSLGSALERFRSDVSRVAATSLTGTPEAVRSDSTIGELSGQMASIQATVEQLEALKTEDRRSSERTRVR